MNTQMYILGQVVEGLAAPLEVINPASAEIIASCRSASAAQVDDAIAFAQARFEHWQHTPDAVIREHLLAISAELLVHKAEIASLISLEQGKPIALAELEVELSVIWINTVADFEIPIEEYQEANGKKILVYNRPVGVVASITPWNWPFMIATWHLFPALKAKNCVIHKPSEYTPLSSILLVEIINRHLPAGVCNLVLGAAEVGSMLSSHTGIAKLSFTGSIRTGKSILQHSAYDLKSVLLELGGNDLGIVLADVDVDEVAEKIFAAAFLNSGQTCACLKRLYVQKNIYQALLHKLSNIMHQQVLGSGLDPESTLGPLQNQAQFDKVKALIDGARERGATLIQSIQVLPTRGYFIAPTLVTDITEDDPLVTEEQFGPVLPILPFDDLDQVIAQNNQLDYGLGASVWSKDLDTAHEIAMRLQSGTVWINSHCDLSPRVAFGGWKHSGLGFSFGVEGLLHYTHKQAIHVSMV